MHISKSLLGVATLFMAICSSVQAAPLVSWTFTGLTGFGPATLNGTPAAGGITATLSRGPGLTTEGSGVNVSYGGNGISTTSLENSVAQGDYFVFNIQAAEGTTFSLDSIDAYSIIRNPTTGANLLMYWQYSADGGAFTTLSTPGLGLPIGSSGGGKPAISLSSIPALQDVSSVQFRLGFYGNGSVPTSTTGVFLRNNSSGGFSLSGSAVPEPSSFLLLGLGSVALFGRMRKRRTK